MTNDLTPSEARFVRALCVGSGPLGLAPIALARTLDVTSATVINLAVAVERKGFCTRERYGMRLFLRPTQVATEFVMTATEDAYVSGTGAVASGRKVRAPRQKRLQ